VKDSPISSTVDFDKDGVQHGFLKLPHSHDDSAWGSIVIPISVAKMGVVQRFFLQAQIMVMSMKGQWLYLIWLII